MENSSIITARSDHGFSEGDKVVIIKQDGRWWAKLILFLITWCSWNSPVKKTCEEITSVTKTTFTIGEKND
jgi:hypothetical protein